MQPLAETNFGTFAGTFYEPRRLGEASSMGPLMLHRGWHGMQRDCAIAGKPEINVHLYLFVLTKEHCTKKHYLLPPFI